jgi:hypothetical protein
MLCHHLRVFKVFSYQFLCKLKKEDVLLSLLKCAVLSEPHVAVGEFPEFLGELEPRFECVGSRFLLCTALHESQDSFPE